MVADESIAGETTPHPPAVRIEVGSSGEAIYPPLDGASRAFGLPQAAANAFLRAEARTHFSLTGGNASPPHLKNCAT